jgi:hypothetical protein
VDKKRSYDFVSAIFLILFSLYIIFESFAMNSKSTNVFYTSPGFLPLIFASLLILCSLLLIKKSVAGISFGKAARKSWENLKETLMSKPAFNVFAGLIILGIYTFVLLAFMPYWLASLVFLMFIMIYMRSASVLKAVLISCLSVGFLVVVFEYLLNVRLP